MSSLFHGLNIAKNTLTAQTQVLNVTGHNVSNADTPGYSRQTAVLVAVTDVTGYGDRSLTDLCIGSGAEATVVERARSALYDEMYRTESTNMNYYEKTEDLMSQVELLFNEPSDSGFSGLLNDFYGQWQDLSNDPQNMATRQSLKSKAQELTDFLQRLNDQLLTIKNDIDTEISKIPDSINGVTAQIAELNTIIRLSEIQGEAANDLRDRRDSLVDDLTRYGDVRAVEQSDGSYTVLVGSKVVVEHDNSTKLYAVSTATGDHSSIKTIIQSKDGMECTPSGGELGALMDFRDTTINDILDQLDTIAGALVESVNAMHNGGYGLDGLTGRDFFNPNYTKAYNITLSEDISNVSAIAASGTGAVGDGINALNINALSDSEIIRGKYTISEYYAAMISDIGVQASEAAGKRSNSETLVNQIDNSREEISGVSIDEELIKMIQAQHIYQSASRVLVTIDSLLETLVNLK